VQVGKGHAAWHSVSRRARLLFRLLHSRSVRVSLISIESLHDVPGTDPQKISALARSVPMLIQRPRRTLLPYSKRPQRQKLVHSLSALPNKEPRRLRSARRHKCFERLVRKKDGLLASTRLNAHINDFLLLLFDLKGVQCKAHEEIKEVLTDGSYDVSPVLVLGCGEESAQTETRRKGR
jgi:hypothetical protein